MLAFLAGNLCSEFFSWIFCDNTNYILGTEDREERNIPVQVPKNFQLAFHPKFTLVSHFECFASAFFNGCA